MAINQAYLFLIFTLNGVFIGLLFDFFRILRKSFKTNNIVTYVEDILFWMLAGISILISMYNFSGGELRLYMILGLALGIIIYILTVSKYIIRISVFIINTIKIIVTKTIKIIIYPIKLFYNITDHVFLRPVYVIYIKNKQIYTKTSKYFKEKIQKNKKNRLQMKEFKK